MKKQTSALAAHTLRPAERKRRERGISLIFMAILGLVVIGLMGIAIDAAYVASTAQQLQHSADAASLAAARWVKYEIDPANPSNPFTLTRQAAIDVALANEAARMPVKLDLNEGNDPNGDIVIGIWDPAGSVFIPDLLEPNAVRVRARRTEGHEDGPISLWFGPAFGSPTSQVAVTSTAALAASGALMVILDPDDPGALSLNGTVLMAVNGDIHVNSSANCAADLEGEPEKIEIFSHTVCVLGTACYNPNAIQGTVVEGDTGCVVPDPLAGVLPTTADWDAMRTALAAITPVDGSGNPLTIIDQAGTYSPGYYPAGLDLASTKKVTLNPGTYMFGPPGVKLKGSSFVTAGNATPTQCADSFAGVTLLIDEGATMDISGNGAGMSVTAPETGPLANIAIFHHRNNTGDSECKITGGGAFVIRGYIYCPSGELVMGGGPGKAIGGIVTNTLSNAGTTSFKITGCGVPLPEDAVEGTYLVE